LGLCQPTHLASIGRSRVLRLFFGQLSEVFSRSCLCQDAIRARLRIGFCLASAAADGLECNAP
jgi:hypothetical protein